MVILYTTHCPKCKVVEMKLKQKNIAFSECENVDEMLEKGLRSAPGLNVDGLILDFAQSVAWINKQGVKDKVIE